MVGHMSPSSHVGWYPDKSYGFTENSKAVGVEGRAAAEATPFPPGVPANVAGASDSSSV